jgi:LacI family transcriptional regulator
LIKSNNSSPFLRQEFATVLKISFIFCKMEKCIVKFTVTENDVASFYVKAKLVSGEYNMVHRPTIDDLARVSGVSKSTIDRLRNRRKAVGEDTAKRILDAAEKLGYHATGLLKRNVVEAPKRRFGFLLQKKNATFYSALGHHLALETTQARSIQGKAIVEYVDEIDPQIIAERFSRLAAKVDAIAIVPIEHPLVNEAIERVCGTGKPVFTLASDVSSTSRLCNLAVDSRRRGRTAAWAISRMAERPGKVGILIGSHGYISQETVEMSFRSYFREHEPEFQLLEPVVDLEDDDLTYRAVQTMLQENPDIVGIYSMGGGEDGYIAALREAGRKQLLVSVCNEIMPSTRAGLIDRSLALALVTPIAALAARTVESMAIVTEAVSGKVPSQILFPAELYNSESV